MVRVLGGVNSIGVVILHVGKALMNRNAVAVSKFLRVKKALPYAANRYVRVIVHLLIVVYGSGKCSRHRVVSRADLRRESLGLETGTWKLNSG